MPDTATQEAPPAAEPLGRVLGTPVAVGLAAVIVGSLVTGATAILVLGDAGPVVRWGIPILSTLVDLLSAATVGFLGAYAFLIPDAKGTGRRATALRYAEVSAMFWALAAYLLLVLTFADLAGVPVTSPGLFTQFRTFLWPLEPTRILFLNALLATVVFVFAKGSKSRGRAVWLLAFATLGALLPSLTGHAAGSASHEDAVNALAVHLLGVSVWVGGLIALVALRRNLGADLGVSVARFSVVATWAYALVALSGIQQAVIRVGSLANLGTPYGMLVTAKLVLLIGLGFMGAQQRRASARRLALDPGDGRAFARFSAIELALMGAATGLAAALSRSLPPVPDAEPNPSLILDLTGYPDPGPFGATSWITAWRIDWLLAGIAVVAVGLYLAGARRLAARGDAWPVLRTISWVIGWGLFVYATSGFPGIWGRVLFSVHMVEHMIIAMIVPLFLVVAAPLTLLLRAVPPRTDGSWGARELALAIVHSRAMRVLANPVVAAVLFFFSLALFYYSPLFELALTTHTGHLLMIAHFFLTGYLFVWVLIGIDPGPKRWSPVLLLVILWITVSFHAFFGVILTGSDTLLAPDFYGVLDLPWGPDPLQDQREGGAIAWGVGEAPTLILAVIVAVQWYRSDRKETTRLDRQADRDGGTELAEYNAYLAALADSDEARGDAAQPAPALPPRTAPAGKPAPSSPVAPAPATVAAEAVAPETVIRDARAQERALEDEQALRAETGASDIDSYNAYLAELAERDAAIADAESGKTRPPEAPPT